MQIKRILIIAMLLLPYSFVNGQVNNYKDVFPLSHNLTYTYSFQKDTLFHSVIGEHSSRSDSGFVSYTILDSIKTNDSTLTWHIREIRQLIHKAFFATIHDGDTVVYFDTTYNINDTTVLPLTEYTNGQHELVCQSQIWSFPLINYSTSIFRYQGSSHFVLVHLLPPSWGSDTLIFSEGAGLTRRVSHKWNQSSAKPAYYNENILLLEVVTNVREPLSQLPQKIRLEQNYPNPFNSSTIIRYSLPIREHVILAVYDVRGRLVKIILEGQQEKGSHQVIFEPKDLASGIYFCKLKCDNFITSGKMSYLK
jgi:hypothetical protein